MIKKILYLIIGIIIFSTNITSTFGQGLDFQIYPTIIEIESEPGQIIKHQFIVRGSGGGNYFLKIHSLEVTDKSGHFISSKKANEYVDWVTLNPTLLNFDAYEEKKVDLIINIPENTALGDYYLTIAMERELDDTKQGPVLGGSLEIPLLITVMKEGEPKLAGLIEQFKTQYIDFFNPVKFNIQIKNSGIRKLKSFGILEINNKFTNKRYSKELIPQNVLAESSRIAVDEEGFVQGNDYVSWVSPDIFGIYSAKVDLYDKFHSEDNAQILTSSPELTFVYIDFFLLLGIILSIALFVLLYFYRKLKL